MQFMTVDLSAMNDQIPHTIVAELRPDIVVWNDDSHELILF